MNVLQSKVYTNRLCIIGAHRVPLVSAYIRLHWPYGAGMLGRIVSSVSSIRFRTSLALFFTSYPLTTV
jgi:hypothetical protein